MIGVLGEAYNMFPFMMAFLCMLYRRLLARHTVRFYNRIDVANWDRRAERVWEYNVIFVCVGFAMLQR
jgi:hypothetical protein